jgi:hypothetical protein
MKKVLFFAIILVCVALIMVTAGFRTIPNLLNPPPDEKKCVGYTIIAFDQGVDCHGDTIKLVRINGFAEKEVK